MSSTHHTALETGLGELTVVLDDAGLAGLYFPGHWTRPDPAAWGPLVDTADDERFAEVGRQLADYLAGTRQAFDLPLSLRGSPQAQAVWALLREIPFGDTTTYGALAARLTAEGHSTHARAVGHFVGHNPVSVVVPCHRVVGADGRLTGYAGGLERKEQLLTLEGALTDAPLMAL